MLIAGPPGSGKSSLALALLDRGAQLIGDDGVTLECEGACIVARPPPNIAGLLEVRNVGLMEMPTTTAPLAIAIVLNMQAERLPTRHGKMHVLGRDVPQVELYPDTPWLALRAKAALERCGAV